MIWLKGSRYLFVYNQHDDLKVVPVLGENYLKSFVRVTSMKVNHGPFFLLHGLVQVEEYISNMLVEFGSPALITGGIRETITDVHKIPIDFNE